MRIKGWRGILLAASLLFIAAATLTPGSPFSSGGMRPDFWCFACGAEGGADITLNIALFVPLGVALALAGVSPVRALCIGLLVSVGVESAQHLGWATGRVASATDIATNTAGTVIGAFVAWHSDTWLHASVRWARALAILSAVSAIAFLYFTAWALSPDDTHKTLSARATGFRLSQFPYTPGYGWYHGRVSAVTINDAAYEHAGDGPVVLRGWAPDTMTGRVTLSGRDERREFIPLLYVHDLSIADPLLMLGQQDRSAKLEVRLRAHRLKLPGPSMVLREAFAERDQTNQAIQFSVTASHWTLATDAGDSAQRAVLPISLSLGWTLLQTVVHVGDPIAWAISAAWLLVMWLPFGYWLRLSSMGGSNRAILIGVAVVAATLWMIPASASIAHCSALEWVGAIGGMSGGVFFAKRYRAKQSGVTNT